MKSKTTAGMSALFGGGIGLQYFYLGDIPNAVFSLFFCWTFLPAIIGFFQGCSILGMSEEKFQEKYVK